MNEREMQSLLALAAKRLHTTPEALRAAAKETGLLDIGRFSGGDAGLHLLLWLEGRNEAELVRRAAEAGVGLSPLSAYDLAPAPSGREAALILGYTHIAAEDMTGALLRLKAAWGF